LLITLKRLKNTTTLDTAVYEVGHHGSHNGSTTELLHYGHPRKVTMDMLTLAIHNQRSAPIEAQVAEGVENFKPYTVRKRIYATGWDGTVSDCG